MRRGTWFNRFIAEGANRDLPAHASEELARLDTRLYTLWNLGENVLLAWTQFADELLVLCVRHYAIAELAHAGGAGAAASAEARGFVNEVLSGPKYLHPQAFEHICSVFGCEPQTVRLEVRIDNDRLRALVSDMVRSYGVSLVRNRAVVLLDAVEFSLQSALDQVVMLSSLSYSVNSAYGQLLSKDIRIDFARTTTGDGFYIWNRSTTAGANTELYKLMMMILADNAAAHAKARSPWVPKLRAAFHVGQHYEFHQVDGLNPTDFSYIVGEVTVDLARMVERALPGQILIGDFEMRVEGNEPGQQFRQGAQEFVESTAATLEPLVGLEISGGRIDAIRCYLTGANRGDGHYEVNRYHLRDKHSTARTVYNAKINIHRKLADPIFLGIRGDALDAFQAFKVESLGAARLQ